MAVGKIRRMAGCVALLVVAVSAAFMLGVQYQKHREGASEAVAATNAVGCVTNVTACATNQVTVATNAVAEKVELKVERVTFDGDNELWIFFNERPDADVARHYITAGPLIDGSLSFTYRNRYNYDRRIDEPALRIIGNFAYRTNLTLRVLRGFPLAGKGKDPSAEGALAADFVHPFKRRDPRPAVSYADDGRYLPPGGKRALRVESVSVGALATEIRRVEPRNIVQLLAREESVYRCSGWRPSADKEDTEELSGLCETGVVRCVNRPCEKEINLLPVGMRDGGPERGIFLVAARDAGRPRSCWWDDINPNRYRLVCLSDLGLSVRRAGKKLGVWVVSLTTGRPVPETAIEVYSSANILLATGTTDANGWCDLTCSEKGNPFAVVAIKPERQDMTFLALRDSMKVDEDDEDGARANYLEENDTDVFLWTDRGIYRHGERIFVHGIVRNGKTRAPKPLPLVLTLKSPRGNEFETKTLLTDTYGTLSWDGFSVPHEQPSGKWKLTVGLPGRNGKALSERVVKIEEFAPPQIRVRVAAAEAQHPTNFSFAVSAEHLFGGPASALRCSGAVVFEDMPFRPAGWKGFHFGNDDRGLNPNFRELPAGLLDERGRFTFAAPLEADTGRPKAAVRAIGQGVVFEDGGRPATARKAVVCHYYPYYIGSTLKEWMKLPRDGAAKIDLVCVDPEGKALAGERELLARIERIDSVYAYRKNDEGWSTWDCDRVRSTLFEGIVIKTDAAGRATYALPMREGGDYVFTVEDPRTGVSFGRTFYLSCWGDDAVRAPLSDPTAVGITCDRPFYRVGETPRLVVKAPFKGAALMSVVRDGVVYNEVLDLTNATSEVVLRPVERSWAPNVDVMISVVQSVEANAKHLAVRARGQTTVRVRPAENEIEVGLTAEVKVKAEGEGVTRVVVDIAAQGAEYAVVTLVDEGINLFTDEPVPNPVAWFAKPRTGDRPLYDLYHRVLPVVDDGLKASGVKTGGGFGAEMLGRVSPVATRRFRPLALWKERVAIRDGRGRAVFELPEFVGEVRVTAVAYSPIATGAAAIQRKVTPKLVMQADAPRFAAPGDSFQVTLSLRNTTDREGAVGFEIDKGIRGDFRLGAGASTNVVAMLTASAEPGERAIRSYARGLGEVHEETLLVPVRPAVAWEMTRGVADSEEEARREAGVKGFDKLFLTPWKSPADELAAAREWLADYPHGCLEQTSSRIFPLLGDRSRGEYVTAGVRRVESMVRENDFVMWPDCTYAPWDREVSLYAAHFLVEAEKAGTALSGNIRLRVMRFLGKWAMSTNDCVSAYACHTLALAGTPEKDRMFRLYDRKESIGALARARLARAFAAIHDRARAEALVNDAYEPQSIKEAAFRTLALVELNPDDPRLPQLVRYLADRRDKARLSWGTTEENAHALLAMGAYCRARPETAGKARVMWKKLSLPEIGTIRDEASGITISRRYLKSDGTLADLGKLFRGELLIAELTLTSDVTRSFNDLVIEDLFPACFEPVHNLQSSVFNLQSSVFNLQSSVFNLQSSVFNLQSSVSGTRKVSRDWIMRKDARDDRMLVFSKKFTLERNHEATVYYPVRVVSAGDFVLPGPSVEGMYDPRLHSRRAPGRLVVRP